MITVKQVKLSKSWSRGLKIGHMERERDPKCSNSINKREERKGLKQNDTAKLIDWFIHPSFISFHSISLTSQLNSKQQQQPPKREMTETNTYILYIILCFLSTLLLQYLFHISKTTKSSSSSSHLRRLPPSPPSLPLLGHLHLLSPSLHKSFTALSSKFGPLLCLRLGAVRCIVVSSASLATEVFKTQDLAFSSRPKFAFSDETPLWQLRILRCPLWRLLALHEEAHHDWTSCSQTSRTIARRSKRRDSEILTQNGDCCQQPPPRWCWCRAHETH